MCDLVTWSVRSAKIARTFLPAKNRIMKFEEFLKMQQDEAEKPKRRLRSEEHRLQCACVKWFRAMYPKQAGLLYAVPNGGRRDKVTGRVLKDEGVMAGVSDMNLDLPNRFYHGLRIEMKTLKGRQQESQREFQRNVENAGYKYAVCRDLDSFIRLVTEYMKNT